MEMGPSLLAFPVYLSYSEPHPNLGLASLGMCFLDYDPLTVTLRFDGRPICVTEEIAELLAWHRVPPHLQLELL